MQKKKGIILLITIFFIISITALYLKNLDDTEKIIDESQRDYKLSYTYKIIDDLNKLMKDFNTKEYELYTKEGLDDFFDNFLKDGTIPLQYNNVLVNITFERLDDKCNLNHIYNDSNISDVKICDDKLNSYGINLESFKAQTEDIKKDNNITSNKQKNNIIDTYIENNDIDLKEDINDEFTYILERKDNISYLKARYEIFINESYANEVEIIYELTKDDTKVKDIEISIK